MIDNKTHTNYKKLQYLIGLLQLEFPVADLSRATGYSDGTISPYLTGKVKPSTKFLQKVCEVYNVDFKGFVNKETEPERKKEIDPMIISIAEVLLELPLFKEGIKKIQKEISTQELRIEIEKMIRMAEKDKSKLK